MGGHQLAPVEDLPRLRGDACLDRLPQQLKGYRIIVPLDLDMIIEIDSAALPFGVFVVCRWQLLQRRPIDLLVKGTPGRPPTAHWTVFKFPQQPPDSVVQLARGENLRCRSRARI